MASAESTRADSVRDILEVFGAIDQAIVNAQDDPQLLAAADKLLPGSAGNAGWYDELVRRYFPGDAGKEPNLTEALKRIAAADGRNQRLSAPQKARLLYGISTSARLKKVAPSCSLPDLEKPDGTLGPALNHSLAAIAPTGTALKARRDTGEAVRESFVQHVSSSFTRAGDFNEAVRAKAEADIRTDKPLKAPVCKTAVVRVDGLESVVVDTEFDSDEVSLQDLMDIVNPFNWADDYPALFVRMEGQEPDFLPDGWRRVLETIRMLGEEITTPLKFYPYRAGKLEASVDYDLDKSDFSTGDGKVLVDRGFINMKSTSGDPKKRGVHVTTRKVVHIRGLSPFAQGKLVCIGGYGTASVDFLIGAAAKKRPGRKPFYYPRNEDEAGKDPDTTVAPAATAMTHFVPAAVDAWTECAQDLTNDYFDVTQKWLSGSLTMTDLADYTTRVSSELVSTPWKYLQAMTTPRTPGKPGGST
ncbi:hypothetical protein [Mycolicibacterium helvum]|uniref:Uncharacterized protein n=1 Tax=Mycolicibacterium helvum TaxID=1534349 RepID=A0A7I7T7V4_9MYCO|nr:hypothetical protein [Mycolicibacterium helvum]BBY65148.1 hypothetical protein MHEL_33910 [Mycolicibacterium helvum]